MSKQQQQQVDYEAFVDAGNGGVNAQLINLKTGELTTVYFPSVRARTAGQQLGFDKGIERDIPWHEWNGHRYVIGDAVLDLPNATPERHIGEERYGDLMHQHLVDYALAKMGVKSGNVRLTVFAPPKFFKGLKASVPNAFLSGEGSTTIYMKGEREPRTWNYVDVELLPEGVPFVFCVGLNEDGTRTETGFLSGNILIMDIGVYTVDTVLLSNGQINADNMDDSTHANQGIETLIRKPVLTTVKTVGRQQGTKAFDGMTTDYIDQVLRNGLLGGDWRLIGGDTSAIDIEPIFWRHAEEMAVYLANTILSSEYGDLATISKLVLVGGGDPMVSRFFKEWYPGKVLERREYPQLRAVHPVEINVEGAKRRRLAKLIGEGFELKGKKKKKS